MLWFDMNTGIDIALQNCSKVSLEEFITFSFWPVLVLLNAGSQHFSSVRNLHHLRTAHGDTLKKRSYIV